MKNYRFKFDDSKPRKKYSCPSCGRRGSFIRYVDSVLSELLPEQYGRCERVNNCTYWLDPYKDGYAKNAQSEDWQKIKFVLKPTHSTSATQTRNFKPILRKPDYLVHIPKPVLQNTLQGYDHNQFAEGLRKYFGTNETNNALALYYIGTSDLSWIGSTTFPFIDINHHIRAIQVKLFDDLMHTAKYTNATGEVKSCTNWLHSELEYNTRKANSDLPDWIEPYKQQESKASCFFGEHLLNLPGNKIKPVAIVEAPKTAVIASIYFSKILKEREFIWLAAGALGYLTPERCSVLQGRDVILFPDLGAFNRWQIKAKELSDIARFTVSDLLESKATQEEKLQGLDLADYLLRSRYTPLQSPVSLNYADVINMPVETHTGHSFDGTVIGMVETSKGTFDILFDKNGDFLNCDKNADILNRVSKFLNKKFEPILFEGITTWGREVCKN